jgi:hypothetical protein
LTVRCRTATSGRFLLPAVDKTPCPPTPHRRRNGGIFARSSPECRLTFLRSANAARAPVNSARRRLPTSTARPKRSSCGNRRRPARPGNPGASPSAGSSATCSRRRLEIGRRARFSCPIRRTQIRLGQAPWPGQSRTRRQCVSEVAAPVTIPSAASP